MPVPYSSAFAQNAATTTDPGQLDDDDEPGADPDSKSGYRDFEKIERDSLTITKSRPPIQGRRVELRYPVTAISRPKSAQQSSSEEGRGVACLSGPGKRSVHHGSASPPISSSTCPSLGNISISASFQCSRTAWRPLPPDDERTPSLNIHSAARLLTVSAFAILQRRVGDRPGHDADSHSHDAHAAVLKLNDGALADRRRAARRRKTGRSRRHGARCPRCMAVVLTPRSTRPWVTASSSRSATSCREQARARRGQCCTRSSPRSARASM